jgi:hypothetical protein
MTVVQLANEERVREHMAEALSSAKLTPHERQTALLVREELSDPEMSAQLFLSPQWTASAPVG